MTFETPGNLLQLRTALIERCQLNVNDPKSSVAVLNRYINRAVRRFTMANPWGWWWDWRENEPTLSQSLVAGSNQFGYVMTDIGGQTFGLRVREVFLRDVANTWAYPLERVTRREQLDRYPRVSETGVPRTWSIIGQNSPGVQGPKMFVFLAPAADVDYQLIFQFLAPGPPLVNDTDPAKNTRDTSMEIWADAVLEYAAMLVHISAGNTADALAAKAAFDSQVMTARRSNRRVGGPGYGQMPVADDRNLP